MILLPRRLGRVLVEVARADVMVLALHHPAKAGKVGLHFVGVQPVAFRVGDGVIDAPGTLEHERQFVPMGRFVSVDSGGRGRRSTNDFDPFGLALAHKRQSAPAALTNGDDNAALASLVASQAAVLAVFLTVLRADMPTEVGAIDFDFTVDRRAWDFRRKRLTDLVSENERRLVLAVEIA